MAQSNYTLANKSAPASRAKINDVFQSIATNNSGTAPPSTTFPHQWWYDTTTNILKQRNAADSAWIDIGSFDQAAGTFTPFGVTQLTQPQAEDPTSTVFGTVSGQRLAQAVTSLMGNTYAVGSLTLAVETSTGNNSADTTVSGGSLRDFRAYVRGTESFPLDREDLRGSSPGNSLPGTWRRLNPNGRGTRFGWGLFVRIS